MKAARKLRRLQQPQSLMEFVRQFLTPQVWKQARQAVPSRRRQPRWDLQPLVLVLLAMTWTAGDSELERFEAARGFYVMSYEGLFSTVLVFPFVKSFAPFLGIAFPLLVVLVLTGASIVELRDQAVVDGMLTLRMDGLKKLERGITTLEEVVKETSE